MELTYTNTISAEDYNRLRRSVGWKEIAPRQAEIGLANTYFQVAAVSGGGYVYYIADVVVDPEFQGIGIGKAMMESILSHVRASLQEGERAMVLLMAAKGKEPFYLKLDFCERPNETFGAGMSQWIEK